MSVRKQRGRHADDWHIDDQLLTRKSDCSDYRKLPARPDDEVRWLLRAWRGRVRQGN